MLNYSFWGLSSMPVLNEPTTLAPMGHHNLSSPKVFRVGTCVPEMLLSPK